MLSILIRIVGIYLVIGLIRNIWRGYKTYLILKNNKAKNRDHDNSDIVDAEFRKLKDDDV